MKIVIDIDENVFTRLFDNGTEDYEIVNDDLFAIAKSIRKGTPLPKHHGDLIDKDRLLDELEKTVKSVDDTNRHLLFWDRAVAHVHLSKPIIEADKGVLEKINEKQNSLRATCKAWDEAIEKDGYVN